MSVKRQLVLNRLALFLRRNSTNTEKQAKDLAILISKRSY